MCILYADCISLLWLCADIWAIITMGLSLSLPIARVFDCSNVGRQMWVWKVQLLYACRSHARHVSILRRIASTIYCGRRLKGVRVHNWPPKNWLHDGRKGRAHNCGHFPSIFAVSSNAGSQMAQGKYSEFKKNQPLRDRHQFESCRQTRYSKSQFFEK